MKNKYILLRHGETKYQAAGSDAIYFKEEQATLSLTDKGKEQIKATAKIFKDKKIDLIFASDYFRTQQAAKIVSEELGGLKIQSDKRLRDTNFGIFCGKSGEEYRDFFSSKAQRFQKRIPKGENWRDVKKRMAGFVKILEKKYKGKIILIISHADPLWLLAGYLKGLTEAELLENRGIGKLWLDVGQFIEI